VKIRLVGHIVDAEPRLPSRITGKCLILGDRGRDHMIFDSGFAGSVSIPEAWADRLDLRYAGIQTFALANGQIVEFPTYLGIIRLGQAAGLFEIIVTGEALLGMEFLQRLNARVIMDCKMETLSVTGALTRQGPSKSKSSKNAGSYWRASPPPRRAGSRNGRKSVTGILIESSLILEEAARTAGIHGKRRSNGTARDNDQGSQLDSLNPRIRE